MQCSAVQGSRIPFYSIPESSFYVCEREGREFPSVWDRNPFSFAWSPTTDMQYNAMHAYRNQWAGGGFFFFETKHFLCPGRTRLEERIRDGFVVWKPTSQPVSICYTTVPAQTHADTCRQNQMWGCHGVRWIPLFPTGRKKTSLASSRQSSPVQVRSVLRRIAKFADLQIPIGWRCLCEKKNVNQIKYPFLATQAKNWFPSR